ncbi:MAG: hypothetical protein ABFS86_15755 [Planctomycetota bacterium]
MANWSMKCRKCGADLGDLREAAASICLRPREDEETRTYFFCEACGVWSVWLCIEDQWTDEDKLIAVGPVSREEGDRIVALIGECPDPGLSWCRCPVHGKLNGTLA